MKSKPSIHKFPQSSPLVRPRVVLRFGTFFLLLLVVASCSTQKDRFFNRNWHDLNSKYNVLFNGEMAFDQAWNQLQNGFEENFWEPLPIERFVPNEREGSAALGVESPFSLAEEKAVKAIKKHGMTLSGEEKNPQMVAAYSLLGRARYYDQRFVPALEAFNYIIRRYPASNKLNETRIWKEKTNLRLGNEEVALENIKRLLKFRKLKGQLLSSAYAVRAQAYRELGAIDSSAWDLKRALKHSKKPLEKARYAYILGQLYQAQQQSDSALWAYEQVMALNRKIPRIFLIQSSLQALFLKAKSGNTDQEAIGALSKLENDWENAPFLDRIYYEKAQLLAARDQDSLAIVYAQKSLKASKLDPRRNEENYRLIAEIYFDQAQMEPAAKYYDSLLQQLDPNGLAFLRTQRKINGLKEVVFFENQASVSDSLLALAAMAPVAQKAFVSQKIKQLQLQDSLAMAKLAKTDALPLNPELQGGSPKGETLTDSGPAVAERPSSFYFYNAQAVSNGALAFQAQWGDRALVDNWRWTKSPKAPKTPAAPQNDQNLPAASDKPKASDPSIKPLKPTLATDWADVAARFLAGIPKTSQEIDSLHTQNEQAYFQLGRLYAQHFNRPDLAIDRLLKLYKKPASPDLMPPTIYALYELYRSAGSFESEALRSELLDRFPNSDQAQILRDPEGFSERLALAESRYDSLYAAYLQQDYGRVMTGTTSLLSTLLKDPKAAPIALLQANTIGRWYGFAAYKSALKKLQTDYPNTAVATLATSRLKAYENQPPKASFGPAAPGDRVYLALLFSETYHPEQDLAYREAFKQQHPNYSIRREVYVPGKTFYIISGFESEAAALEFSKGAYFEQNLLQDPSFFVILGSHYKTLQLFKNLPAYTAWQLEQKKALKK